MHFELKSVLAAGCLLAASALSVAAFEAVTVEPAELREGAGWDFEPIVELPQGSIVEVLNCDREWCEASVEDYDGFLPRSALDLGTVSPPVYVFPPLISQPSLWHGRYFSRDHFRYESRSRWRNREGQRIHVVPSRPQPRPLRPIVPGERRRTKQFDQRGPTSVQPRIERTPDQPRIQRTPDQPRIQRAPDQPRIQRAPDQPRIQRAPDQPRTMQRQPQSQPQIQRQAPVQRQAPASVPQRTAPPAGKEKQKGSIQ